MLYAAVGSLTRAAPQFAQARGEGVTLCRFDDDRGVLTPSASPLRIENGSWIVADVARGQFHVVTDCDGGRQSALESLRLDVGGATFSCLGSVPAGGHEGCHAALSRDGDDAASGQLTINGRVELTPDSSAQVQPSGIVLHPDGLHLFVALRLTDEIVTLAIDPQTGLPALAGRHPSGGTTPRDLVLSPSGRFLLVSNQDSDCITVWPVSHGQLGPEPASSLTIGTPMVVALADFT